MSTEMKKIKYEGMELKEVTEPQVFERQPMMVVWDDDGCKPVERLVAAIVKVRKSKIVTVDVLGNVWEHCANIPEKPAPRRATQRELVKWLAQGNGEWCNASSTTSTSSDYIYCYDESDELLVDTIRVRKWCDTEWHEATVDYMEIP